MRSSRKDRLLTVVWALVVITLVMDMLVLATGCPPNGVSEITMDACKTTCAPRVVRRCTYAECECETSYEPPHAH